jgi:pyruvate/2-oxoglutarate dehydrogenase complex dihydrolipoamide dehydrogenase (E3) component
MKKTIKPEIKNIKTIGVIGAGQMGRGIAQVVAQTGYDAIVVEPYDAMLKKSQSDLARNLSRLSLAKSKTRKRMRLSRVSGLKKNSQRLPRLISSLKRRLKTVPLKPTYFHILIKFARRMSS